MRKNKIIIVAIALLFFLTGCAMLPTASTGDWKLNIQNWSIYQKANFFITTWQAEKQAYDSFNALENKPEDLVESLKFKYKILENSRMPIRTYASLVMSGGVPSLETEQQIINWIQQLQIQYVYGGK